MSLVAIKEVSVTLDDCPRCGEKHEGLGLHTFERPVVCGCGFTFPRYAICPKTLHPILVTGDLPKWVHEDLFLAGNPA